MNLFISGIAVIEFNILKWLNCIFGKDGNTPTELNCGIGIDDNDAI